MNITEPLSPNIRGIAYPLRIENGNLAVVTDYSVVAQQIRSVLETYYFERVLRADYGIGNYIFDVLNPGQINSAIQSAILANVSGLTSLNVQGDWESQGNNGLYKVSITYSVGGVPQAPVNFALSV